MSLNNATTLEEFETNNNNDYTYWLNQYPWLNDVVNQDTSMGKFPPSMQFLNLFYQQDMGKRMLPTDSNFEKNYEALLDYFLANWQIQDDPSRQTGNTPLGYLIDAIPGAIQKTGTEISDGANSVLNWFQSFGIYILIIAAIVAVIYLKSKKG